MRTSGTILASCVALAPMLAFIMGCEASSSPTSPTPTPVPTPAPAPAPAPGTVSLTGRVTDEVTTGGLSGVTVLILDGVNAGRSVTTDGDGDYRFDALQSGDANLSATAAGYLETRIGVLINGTNVLNFPMWPVSAFAPRPAPVHAALSSISPH